LKIIAATFALAATTLAAQSYVPNRVYDSAHKRFADFESMLADVANSDVVFVGEQHDDPNTHRLELAVLEGLRRRRQNLIVAFEMFERDVQEPLDGFGAGRFSEDEFLKASRPWPRYATDYKPLIDFAVAHHLPIVASNVPRPIASDVSRTGLDALQTKSDTEKKWFAADLNCPLGGDDYYKRFVEAMGSHPGATGTDQFYYAQCLKDETMGESVANAWRAGATGGKRPLVVHFNGAFHSDFREGTAARAARRLPGKRVLVLSVLPVPNLDALAPAKPERKRANYLVYTIGKTQD
jgi:uncharacterized iron-regulated protein